jgi:PGF-pre-PGF domain-containing protein
MKDFNKETGVKEIQIEVNNNAQNVKIIVSKYESKPANVSVSKDDTYKYLQVETKNLTDKLKKAIMKVQVEKSWVSGKRLTKEEVAVFKFDETAKIWNKLDTTFNEEDTTYYYYSVELNSFSYFAISASKSLVSETGEGTTAQPESNLPWTWIIVGLVVLLVLIGGGFALKKKRK